VLILGIDPGSVVTGFGVVSCEARRVKLVSCGSLKPDPKLPFPQRLLTIYDGLLEVIADTGPTEAAVEATFFGANVQTLMKMCHARGAILLALANANLPIHEYAPREVKKAVVGRGAASKEQVEYMVRRILGMGESAEPLDVTDAVAVAVCHANRSTAPSATVPGRGGSQTKAPGGAKGRTRLEEKLSALGVDAGTSNVLSRPRRSSR